jgi:hypothetical protein
LRAHLEKNGFSIVKQEFLLSPAFWVQSFHHYFYDKKSALAKFFTLNNLPVTMAVTAFDMLLKVFYKTSNQRVVARV